MLVKQVLRHLVVLGIHAGQVGDVVTKLLDGLHLLFQVVGLQEIAQLKQNCLILNTSSVKRKKNVI